MVMTIRAALLAGLLALSGCASMQGMGGFRDGGSPPSGGNAVMVGGLVAGSIGSGLGAAEQQKALAAEYQALEYAQSGQAVNWTGSSAGRFGSVVPAQPYRVGSQDCRQFAHKVVIDGSTRTARGTACRNTDGSWATLT
jgi:surface antigen